MRNLIFSTLIIVFPTTTSLSQMLYDQTALGVSNGMASSYIGDFDVLIQCADDFIIPAGDVWEITSVTIEGFRISSGSSMDSMLVQIYSNAGGPGTLLYTDVIMLGPGGVPGPQTDTLITLSIPELILGSGTYWLSVSGYTQELVSNWFWKNHGPPQTNAEAQIIDVDDFLGNGATVWTPLSATGSIQTDFVFQIGGVSGFVDVGTEKNNSVSVFPNPAIDYLTINIEPSKIKQIKILTTRGQIINIEMNVSNQIDISYLRAGVYFIEINTTEGVLRQRFIKN